MWIVFKAVLNFFRAFEKHFYIFIKVNTNKCFCLNETDTTLGFRGLECQKFLKISKNTLFLPNKMINFPRRLQMNTSIQIKNQEILTVGTSFPCCAGNSSTWTFINQATCLNQLLLFQFYHDCDLFLRFRGLERSNLLRTCDGKT